jgi:hypothetical protein
MPCELHTTDPFVAALRAEPEGPALWRNLRERGAEFPLLESIAEIVLTPDLFFQGLFAHFWSWLDRWDAEVLAAIPRFLTPAGVSHLYANRITHANTPGRQRTRWLTARLFELGPILFLLLRRRGPNPGASFQRVVRDAKGRSAYGEHGPDSIRAMSPISDRAFSLVHSADDEAGLLHECEFFLGAAGLSRALDPCQPALGMDEVALLIPETEVPSDPHPLALVPRLAARALAVLLCDPRTPLDRDRIRRSISHLDRMRDDIARHLSFDLGWRDLSEIGTEVRPLAAELQSASGEPAGWREEHAALARREFLSVVAALCDKRSVSSDLVFAAEGAFRGNNVPLSQWDQHRLHVLAAFHGADFTPDQENR